jgi:hypothetical protein
VQLARVDQTSGVISDLSDFGLVPFAISFASSVKLERDQEGVRTLEIDLVDANGGLETMW